MIIREYQSTDRTELAEFFYNTIYTFTSDSLSFSLD